MNSILRRKYKGYWTEKNVLTELSLIINQIGHFPTSTELKIMGREDIRSAIYAISNINEFRKKLGYKTFKKLPLYWNEETVMKELKTIIEQIGHFPSSIELKKMKNYGLLNAIYKNTNISINEFRNRFGYHPIQKLKGYWCNKTIIDELNRIIAEIGHFPSSRDLNDLDRQDLLGALDNNGGINIFRELMGYELLKKPNGYWTKENIIKELKDIIDNINHFPTITELHTFKRNGLITAINNNNGINHFRELLGFTPSLQEKYLYALHSYVKTRGVNSEKLVIEILKEWCVLNNYPEPNYNKKLDKSNIIEIVCDIGKTIGIDVTNTKTGTNIRHKWTRKDYYKLLDELWIVVFSDSITEKDYARWNYSSPNNVKIMSIDDFLKELDYSTNEQTKQKIENYKSCTFHTKEQFKQIKEPIINNLEEYLA